MSQDIDKMIAEVERLDCEATPGPWHRRDAETENGYSTSAVSPDSEEEDGLSPEQLTIAGRTIALGLSGNDAAFIALGRTAAPLLAAEVRRLRAGGCARDQRTTQFCAEAVAKDAEIAKLRDQILNYQQQLHVAEQERDGWRKRHGDVTIDRDHALAMVAEANAEIARLKRALIEPTEQTGDPDSEQGEGVAL